MKNMKNYELYKVIKIDFFEKKLLHGIHDSTGHVVHNIVINKIVSHNFQFLFCFQDITDFVGIYE